MLPLVWISKKHYDSAMIHIYVDESGNLGQSGRYFVLAAAVFLDDKSNNKAKRLVRKAQPKVGDKYQELKSSQMGFVERQELINRLTKIEAFECFYLVIQKSQVSLLWQKNPKNLVYNYFARLLIDEIFRSYDEYLYIILDQRSTSVKSMHSLVDYLSISAFSNFGKPSSKFTIEQSDSRSVYGLQLADLVSGTVYQAYTRKKAHFLRLLFAKIRHAEEFPRELFSRAFTFSKLLDCSSRSNIEYSYDVRRMMN